MPFAKHAVRATGVVVWGLIALGGCATHPKRLPEAGTRDGLYALQAWRMDGRIGVKAREDSWQANLSWDHDVRQERLQISGPLSQGVVSIIVQKDLIYINEGGGHTQLSRNPDSMLRSRLGFAVPLGSLGYWILGVPDPQSAHEPLLNVDGTSLGFRQLGWDIRIHETQQIGQRTLPRKLRVSGAGVTLTIVADDWNIKG